MELRSKPAILVDTAKYDASCRRTVSFDPTFEAWRLAARDALSRGEAPERLLWLPCGAQGHDATPHTRPHFEGGRVASIAAPSLEARAARPRVVERFRVPQAFLERAHYVSFHRDEGKWTLLYRLLWRVAREDPRVFEHVTDPDVLLFNRMHKAVWIEEHKMQAFVRFRKVERDGVEAYVAWYRPHHPILRLGVDFFVRRFGPHSWVLHTDLESASWNGSELTFGGGIVANPFIEYDDREALWNTYNASEFVPSRLNVELLRHKLPPPVRRPLPEAARSDALVAEAPARAAASHTAVRGSALPFLSPPSVASAWSVLPELETAAQSCQGCPLWAEATRVVFGRGKTQAPLALVGEQPGEEEDRRGESFVGPAGAILEDALRAAGLSRGDLYVTNAVKHFKSKREGKRRIHQKPTAQEVAASRPWLERELQTLRPKVLVLLGATAAQGLLGRNVDVDRERGIFLSSAFCANTIITFHPSAVLRAPSEERKSALFAALVEDLSRAKAALSGVVVSRDGMPVPSRPTPSAVAKRSGAYPPGRAAGLVSRIAEASTARRDGGAAGWLKPLHATAPASAEPCTGA